MENLQSTKSVSEKRLRVDIASIKTMLERGELSSVDWVQSKGQLANCLTKRGASIAELVQVLQTGKLKENAIV